jgi:hypothetical protein
MNQEPKRVGFASLLALQTWDRGDLCVFGIFVS